MDFLMVIPSLVVSVWELVESKNVKFVGVLLLSALWLIPLVRSTYWIAIIVLLATYVLVFMLSKDRIPWTFWAGTAILVGSTIFRTYLAMGEPDKSSYWWLLPQKMAQRGADFANNADFTRNISLLLDVLSLTLLPLSLTRLTSSTLKVLGTLVSYMFVFFLWYPTFEVRLTPSYLDAVLWLIGLIPCMVYLFCVFRKTDSAESDFFFFFMITYAVLFASPRGGSFELALLAMIAFPWAVLGRLASPSLQTIVLAGLPPSVGFLFKATGLASMLITAPTVAIVRIYVLILLLGLCYQIAKPSINVGIVPVIIGLFLSIAGIFTGFVSSIAVNLWGGSGAFFSIQNILNSTLGWANIKLDVINTLVPFIIALLASYVFFGEGR